MAGLENLDDWIERTSFPEAGTPLRCGVSGGADSLALLALAAASGCEVTAVHVDHGVRPGGEQEAARVAHYAGLAGAAFESARVQVDGGSNLEARMRAARYGVLGPDAATGHTRDEQAETVLINLLRGSGLRGLGAMQPGHRRPILALGRSDTEAICHVLEWEPFTDPSNEDPAFVRNRIRHEAIPLLNEIGGRDIAPLFVRTADQARQAQQLIDDLAAELDATDVHALRNVPTPVAVSALQRWLREETGDAYSPDAGSIHRVLDVVAGLVIAAEITGGWRVSRSQQRLQCKPSR